MPVDRAEQLAQEHWDYTENVIRYTLLYKGVTEEEIEHLIDFARNLYIPAIIHGYKHAQEDLALSNRQETKKETQC
jgi:hypothetical protein